mgnify:FL=1
MNQSERRRYLIQELIKENTQYNNLEIPQNKEEQKQLLRSLMNIRFACPISDEFKQIQDEYLTEENKNRGIIQLKDLSEIKKDIYLWQGDITRLKVSAIVNAANSGMTGCYQPCHNCIHTYAGIQLRNYCNTMMKKQGHEEPTGQAKITPAYNLPADYVIHTVGPIVHGGFLQKRDEKLLESCYRSCLEIAEEHKLESIAFCCISTGVFMFPNERAAEIAVKTVQKFKEETNSKIKVIFNVFKDEDLEIYWRLLCTK